MNADVTIILTDPDNISTQLTGRVDGLQGLSITYNDELKKSFSSELEFYDDGYDILKNWLLPPAANAFINEINIKIYDNCCNTLIIEGVIKAASIDWCEPICSIKANIVEKQEAADCIKSTLIYHEQSVDAEGKKFLERDYKKVRYCVDIRPLGLQIILITMYTILYIIAITILLPIITALNFLIALAAVLNAINVLDLEAPLSYIQQWLDDLRDRMLICDWYHPTPLVRDYIKNVCDKCGLGFQSSILNDSGSLYYNTLLFSAQIRKGFKPSQTTGLLIQQNLPVETLDTLMENYLKPIFNAQYWIKDGVLIFERKDFFDAPTNIWIDVEELLNNGLIENDRICFSYIDKERPSFANYEYSQDYVDFVGNYAAQRFNKIIDWNVSPYSPTQSGKLDVILQSSPARFRNDNIETDSYTWIATYLPPINFIWGGKFSDYQDYLLLGDHVCANYKFLIWNENSGDETALIESNYPDSITGGVFQDFRIDDDTGNLYPVDVPVDKRFNYPFVFRENGNNLYTLYHTINNPRNGGVKLYNFEFTFNFSCTQYINFDFTKTVRLFKNGEIVYGKVKELNINFVNRTISVRGEV